jgi:UDP:flavonoid glycosyltransferase YjiC (YdhE family)
MGRDQHDIAGRVVAVGAGVALDPNDVGHELLPAVLQVIGERRFINAAMEIARSIANHGGLDAALAVIDRSSHRHDL